MLYLVTTCTIRFHSHLRQMVPSIIYVFLLTPYSYQKMRNHGFHCRVYSETVVWRCSVKKVFLKIMQNSQENICVWVFIKKRFQHRCFPVNFEKFLGTPFFTEYLRWLIVYVKIFSNPVYIQYIYSRLKNI